MSRLSQKRVDKIEIMIYCLDVVVLCRNQTLAAHRNIINDMVDNDLQMVTF